MGRVVPFFLLCITGWSTGYTQTTAPSQTDFPKKLESIPIIERAATSICGTLNNTGNARSAVASIKADGIIPRMISQLAAIGVSVEAGLGGAWYENVLQKDLEKHLKDVLGCRLEVLRIIWNSLHQGSSKSPGMETRPLLSNVIERLHGEWCSDRDATWILTPLSQLGQVHGDGWRPSHGTHSIIDWSVQTVGQNNWFRMDGRVDSRN